MTRRFDHIDLRAPDLGAVTPFYEKLLPALGFTRDLTIEGWAEFFNKGHGPTEFFGITESPSHQPNENRIAFWAESTAEVDQLATLLTEIGARNIEGPGYEVPGYYAVFFEDPAGNRLELCHRLQN